MALASLRWCFEQTPVLFFDLILPKPETKWRMIFTSLKSIASTFFLQK